MRATLERERKLDAPVGFTLPPLGGERIEPRHFTSVYYDVPGGSLAEAGITLRRRVEYGRSVWQLKLPADDARLELEVDGGPAGPPAELLRLLTAHLRHGPLSVVAELRTRRSGELVARDGTSAEVTVDEVAVMDSHRVRDEFVEVEVELRSGRPGYLDVLARELAEAGAEPGAGTPKLLRALGRDGLGSSPGATPFDALRDRLRDQLREIEGHDPGTRLGRDPESLHDMRVAVRRTRALFKAGRPLVATETRPLEDRLQRLGLVLGAVRDLDVLGERLRGEAAELPDGERRAADVLLRTLGKERSAARRRLVSLLGSKAYLHLLDELELTLDGLVPSGDSATLDDLAERQAKKLRRGAKELPESPSDAQLHELRKRGKKARYAAELAGWEKTVRRAKRLQDVLGDHQDATVAVERLHELAAGAPPEQAFAAGRLAEREEARRAEARASWPEAWKRLRRAL